jgi:DNA-directed RNA polymerase subunit RPC12/RpoP
MGIFDWLLGQNKRIREEWASDRNLTCIKCGKKPLLKKSDVMPESIVRSSNNIFAPPQDTIYWKGKDYNIKELQEIVNKTVYDRAGKCEKCGKIFCIGCVNEYCESLSKGYKGCPNCGYKIETI